MIRGPRCPFLAAQHQDHPPGARRLHGRAGVEVPVAGHDGEPAGQPDRGGQLGGGPEPVGHDVGDRAHGAAPLVVGDADVFPGDLRDRVDLVRPAAPAHADRAAVDLAAPLAAGPALGGEEVGRMGELGDVQAARVQVPRHRGQVPEQVVERQQVAQRVEHGDGEIERAAQAEVPHVGLDDGQAGRGGRRQPGGSRAHRRAEVQRGDVQAAAGQFAGVLGRPGRELQDRAQRAGIRVPVLAGPPEQRVHLARDVAVGAGGLVEFRFVVDSGHPNNDARPAPAMVPVTWPDAPEPA